MSNVYIGINEHHGRSKPIGYQSDDRLRHLYMVGKTGAGKSTVFQNMCLQDIQHGDGVLFLDPHGESIDWLLAHIPASRLSDVVLFDPSDIAFPFGLNLLEAHSEFEKDFLVNECIQIFYKLFDPKKTGVIGPQFEHWLRNAALTVMAGPEGGSLIEIPKLFVDREYEKKKRQHLTDPLVIDFWTKQMARTSDFHKSEMLNYFMSKFGPFLNNALMRNIIGQRVSSFDLGQLMDSRSIVLANLSKGKIGELNAHMLGLILISRLQAAVLGRARQHSPQAPFYLYVDEFQNFTTDSFVSILSESRKYGLAVHLTNQYLAQLPETICDGVLGNVGTLISFATGAEDAELLAKEFAPDITALDVMGLQRFNFYIKLMIDGKTSRTFSGRSLPPEQVAGGSAQREHVRALSQLAYGWPQRLVEKTMMRQLD